MVTPSRSERAPRAAPDAGADAASGARAAAPLAPGARIAAAVLLALYAGLAGLGAWVKSEAFDEPMYILASYSYVRTGDLSLNREHPPLAKYLAGLPLLALDLELPDDYQQRPGMPFAFLAHQPRADPHAILFLARLPGVLLGVLLGLYVLRWARLAWGPAAAIAALALYATNPNVIAHAGLVGTNFAVTVFATATLYHAWRWLATGARASLLLAAVALGLALGSKLTALLLLPVLGLVVAATALRRRRPSLLGWGALALAASLGVLYLLYGGEARSLSEARQHARFLTKDVEGAVFTIPGVEPALESLFGDETPIPLLSLLKGIDYQYHHAELGHPTYFHGEVGLGGFGAFYLVSWLIKNPEALTLLLLLGLVSLRRTGLGWAHETCLYGFVALQFLVFSRASVQLGFAYVLPAVPLLCVAAARPLARAGGGPDARERRVGVIVVLGASLAAAIGFADRGAFRWSHVLPWVLPVVYAAWVWRGGPRAASRAAGGLALLVLWGMVASMARQPHALTYFNEWVGGPENGWHWSVLGDDFGQDTAALGRWMKANGVEHIHYDYYGTGDPEVWGVDFTPTFATPTAASPASGLVAVHVSLLARFPDRYRWLAGREPVAKVGHTIFIYDVGREAWLDSYFDAARQRRERADGAGEDDG